MMDCCGEPQRLINYFNQVIHAARKGFARYSVCATPCNEQRLGSSITEANHSSYVGCIGVDSWDDCATQVKNYILCIQELSDKRTSFRVKYRRQVAASSRTTCDETVALMLIKLSKRGFKICEEEYKKSSEYNCCSLLIDGTEQKVVRQRGGSSHSARLTNGKNCLCDVFVAYQVQCRHLFVFYKGKFQLQFVDSKFHAQPLSASSPNPDYTTILSAWCVIRDPYIGSLGDKLIGQRSSTVRSSPPTSPVPTMGEDHRCDDDHDSSQDNHDEDWAGDVTMMCVTTQPDSESFQHERNLANNTTGTTLCAKGYVS
jgi:hypothetical protein